MLRFGLGFRFCNDRFGCFTADFGHGFRLGLFGCGLRRGFFVCFRFAFAAGYAALIRYGLRLFLLPGFRPVALRLQNFGFRNLFGRFYFLEFAAVFLVEEKQNADDDRRCQQ